MAALDLFFVIYYKAIQNYQINWLLTCLAATARAIGPVPAQLSATDQNAGQGDSLTLLHCTGKPTALY